MAIWTKHSEIFQPVVVLDAVDVIEMHYKRPSTPGAYPALNTFVEKQSCANKARLNMRSVPFTAQ